MGAAYERGRILYDQGRHAMAADEFRKELEQFPQSAWALGMLGLTLLRQKKIDDALAAAQAAVAAEPHNGFAHYALAVVTLQKPMKRFFPLSSLRLSNQAMEASAYRHRAWAALNPAMEAVRLEPHHPDFLWFVAAIHFDLGRPKEALDWVERGLQAAPQHVGCGNLRARILLRLKRKRDARATINKTLSINPEHAPTHLLAGWDVMASDPQKAHEHFSQAVRQNPNDADAVTAYKIAQRINRFPIKSVGRLLYDPRLRRRRSVAYYLLLLIYVAMLIVYSADNDTVSSNAGVFISTLAFLVWAGLLARGVWRWQSARK